jgi:hypothetical protein
MNPIVSNECCYLHKKKRIIQCLLVLLETCIAKTIRGMNLLT